MSCTCCRVHVVACTDFPLLTGVFALQLGVDRTAQFIDPMADDETTKITFNKCIEHPGIEDQIPAGSEVITIDQDMRWAEEWNPLSLPYLFVNEMPYYGGFECPDPLSINCGAVDMICQGFAPDTEPSACNTDPGCQLGKKFDACKVCGGDDSVSILPPMFVLGHIITCLLPSRLQNWHR